MTRSSLKYLLVGILVGVLTGGVITAGAATTPKCTTTTPAAHAKTTKKKKAVKKHKATAKKKAKKKKAKKKKPVVPAPVVTGETMNGLFKINPGTYDATTGAKGSYLRMVLAGGSLDKGPYFSNPSSPGGTYTLVSPGTDGGLLTEAYQEPPAKPFSLTGDALANRFMAPQRFTAILFSASTSARDPQTGINVPPPHIVNNGGKLSGQTQAVSAEWNRGFFNQGSPKPDGTSPGLTTPVHGTYDAATKAYTLDWSSAIVGGPFNGFTGIWHLEGTFEQRCAA
jgi:hypothetical protein